MEKTVIYRFSIFFYKSKHGTIDRLNYESDRYTEEDFKTWLNKSKMYMNEEYGKFYYDAYWHAWFSVHVRDSFKGECITDCPYLDIGLDDVHSWEDIEKHIPMVTSLFNTYSNKIYSNQIKE